MVVAVFSKWKCGIRYLRRGVIQMATPKMAIGDLLVVFTFVACFAAFFDPKFRKVCWSLLCKLG